MPKKFSPVINIAKYTIFDEVHKKSFIVMFIISVFFVFLVRGCYQGNYVMNGHELNAEEIIVTVSKVAFQIIAVAIMILTALLAMRVFKSDREEGMQSCIFSKPITRMQYVMGKILGLWILSAFSMFVLHAIIFLTVLIKLNFVMLGYLAASAICSLNLLFVVITMLLLSLIVHDIVAFFCVVGIGITSFVADWIYAIRLYFPVPMHSDATGWETIYYLWPKLSGVQRFALLFITSDDGIKKFDYLYPLVNIFIYCLVFSVLLFWRFKNEDII